MPPSALVRLCAVLLSAALLASCFGSGESNVDGNSSIQGQVKNFSGTIRIRGTGLISRPQSDGFFIFSGVPAGTQYLDFTQTLGSGLAAGQKASLEIMVPADSKIDMGIFKVVGSRFEIGVAVVTPNNPEAAAAAAAAANTTSSETDDDPEETTDSSTSTTQSNTSSSSTTQSATGTP